MNGASLLPAGFIDLDEVPYTVRRSRLLVRRSPQESGLLQVLRATYERDLDESILVDQLEVLDECGDRVQVGSADPVAIWCGPVAVAVTAQDTVHIGPLPAGWSMRFLLQEPDAERELGLPTGQRRLWTHKMAVSDGAQGVIWLVARSEAAELMIRCAGPAPHRRIDEVLSATSAETSRWMARCPAVLPQRERMARLCWWVLGVNTLALGGALDDLAVVPSKRGYVGLWQWDAYFIAIGLRHGDLDLARGQLQLALSRPSEDGQLPDVLHEQGILASSDDLPETDLENLRAMSSPTLAHQRIPLTKPPLTALAVDLVDRAAGSTALAEELTDVIAASQSWWFERSWSDLVDGPAYLHPYSSGLDDSPVFDRSAIVGSPDLWAYLILQDRILETWARRQGRRDEAEHHRSRSQQMLGRLLETWHAQEGRFHAVGEHGLIRADTVLGLMPLLCDGADPEITQGLIASLEDPDRFAAAVPVPTVALADPDFEELRMWRGPVWVNTNWLLIQGLLIQGEVSRAKALRRRTLDMVISGGGPHEYFSCVDAARPPRATTCFGWSAALFIDLAVAEAADET